MAFARTLPLIALLVAALPVGAPALGESAIRLSGSATLVSDYRFRGVSLSNRHPAVQADVLAEGPAGLYAGLWASTSSEYPGADVELDLYGGWSGPLWLLTVSAGGFAYVYPGAAGASNYELFGSLSLPLGPASATIGVNWAPGQANLSSSSRYLYGEVRAGIPRTPITLSASLGHERGGMVTDDSGRHRVKTDWRLAASVTHAPFTFGLAWVGSNLPTGRLASGEKLNKQAGKALVASLSADF